MHYSMILHIRTPVLAAGSPGVGESTAEIAAHHGISTNIV